MPTSTSANKNMWVVDGPVENQDPAFVAASKHVRENPKLYLRLLDHNIEEDKEEYRRTKKNCEEKYPRSWVEAKWEYRSHYMCDMLWLDMNGPATPTVEMGGVDYLQKLFTTLQEETAGDSSLADAIGPRSVLSAFQQKYAHDLPVFHQETDNVDASHEKPSPAVSTRSHRRPRNAHPGPSGQNNKEANNMEEEEKEDQGKKGNKGKVDAAIFPRCMCCIEVRHRFCDRGHDQDFDGPMVCEACRKAGTACVKEGNKHFRVGYYGRLTGIMIDPPA
ncbi:hypothetical protein BDZ45DRAFT_809738 [Acephala macrosclerotiorum]|nr:hypothetical protein BDZ45DRAFT_809738 [Acephala macrosclerotiorum]